MTRLLICDGVPPAGMVSGRDLEIWSHADFGSRLRGGGMRRLLRSYTNVVMVMPRLWLRPRPLLAVLALRLLSSGASFVTDNERNSVRIDILLIVRKLLAALAETVQLPFLLRSVHREVKELNSWAERRATVALQPGIWPLYLKTDLWFSTQVGGSVAHMAGVANHLDVNGGEPPRVFATAANPLLASHIPFTLILPERTFWDFREVPALQFSRTASRDILAAVGHERPSFIYQRYSLNNYAGVRLARSLSAPMVTEYNGSEVWISQHWGRPVAFPRISADIETLNLRAADLIVVVSTPLQDELISRGIAPHRILVNPNGVSPEIFDPSINASDLRQSLGLAGKTVVGFIGTFGPWHGTEELVEAFATVLNSRQDTSSPLHLLMVGDGVKRAETVQKAEKLGILDHCLFTGQVPQKDAPQYLACCDILVAPHVPNPDGTPFFGSPTKLFEYMSMGRPIVASRLGQMQEILEHGRSAWLVEPGDPMALASGLSVLLSQADLCTRLGTAARNDVLNKYTWRHHVSKIVTALETVCS